MSTPFVSIIINNYNYERYLAHAINSALQQTTSNVEVIVVDDGSTDQSRREISRFGDAIKPVYKSNGGQASALNAGFCEARGDLVIFLDADDLLLPNAVERVGKSFDANPKLSKIQYRMEVINGVGQLSGILKPDSRARILKGDIRQQILSFPFDIPWLPTSGNAFSLKSLREIMPIPESYGRAGADWYLTQVATLFGPVEFIDEVLAYYRVHGSNSYERDNDRIDLNQVRQSIHYAATTNQYLKEFACRLGLADSQHDILSVSYIANRMVSYKLDPDHHPLDGDTAFRLCKLGIKAAYRRSDVSFIRQNVFAAWFVAMLISPSLVCNWLATQFLFPDKRKRFNKVVDRL
jgi:glycosyltransferase involved in cell wall biosynthesis